MKGSSGIFTFIIAGIIICLSYACKAVGVDNVLKEIGNFSIIFTSIILDSIPFIIIGSFVSAFIQISRYGSNNASSAIRYMCQIRPPRRLW